MPKAPPREQLFIDGTAPPKDPIIDEACDRWLDSVDAKKGASEDAKLCHVVLLERMREAGLKAHPYLDRATGQRRIVKIKDGDAKLITAKAPKLERVDREPDMAGISSAAERQAEADRALRDFAHGVDRVTRKSKAVADDDPFASTRGALNGGE